MTIYIVRNLKIVIPIFLFFYSSVLYPQNYWSFINDSHENNISVFTDNAILNDTMIITGGKINSVACWYHQLVAFSLDGKKLWENNAPCDIIRIHENFIYTVGRIGEQSDISGYEQIVVSKFDNMGNELFQTFYPDVPHEDYFSFIPNSLEINLNDEILVNSETSVIKITASGDFVWEREISFSKNIKSIKCLSDNTYLLYSSGAIYKSDSNLNLIDSFTTEKQIKAIEIKNDSIFYLNQDRINIIDTSLQKLAEVILPLNITPEEINSFEGSIWLRATEQENSIIYSLNGLNIKEYADFSTIPLSAKFLKAENSIIFCGNTYNNQIVTCFYDNSLKNQEAKLPDIELIDFDIYNTDIEYINANNVQYSIGYRFNAEIIIKNCGTDTINSFAVFSKLHGGMNCAQNFYYEKFEDIMLKPDEQKLFQLEKRIFESGIENNEICFECMSPNSMFETVYENNSLCKTFSITHLNGISDENGIKIYPVPVENNLQIEMQDDGFKQILLFDVRGISIKNFKTTDNKIIIDLSTIKQGVYLLQIISNHKKYFKKIVKTL